MNFVSWLNKLINKLTFKDNTIYIVLLCLYLLSFKQCSGTLFSNSWIFTYGETKSVFLFMSLPH